ncbi:MAG: Druantia anti-phage system protein DruA [Eubacteriales bacterium]
MDATITSAMCPCRERRSVASSKETIRSWALFRISASAWKLAPRDLFIGWSHEQRQSSLHLIVNNSRFLILPWVRVKYLASSVLSLLCRGLASDWQDIYGYHPVLLETFVEQERFQGTCYRAANWIRVGCAQGRGKLDCHKLRQKPVKEIFLFPLAKNFRIILTNGITE